MRNRFSGLRWCFTDKELYDYRSCKQAKIAIENELPAIGLTREQSNEVSVPYFSIKGRLPLPLTCRYSS